MMKEIKDRVIDYGGLKMLDNELKTQEIVKYGIEFKPESIMKIQTNFDPEKHRGRFYCLNEGWTRKDVEVKFR